MLRREVLNLYRQFVRATKDVKDKRQRRELLDFVRVDFERHRRETDTVGLTARRRHAWLLYTSSR
jgi:hypothetical protein